MKYNSQYIHKINLNIWMLIQFVKTTISQTELS